MHKSDIYDYTLLVFLCIAIILFLVHVLHIVPISREILYAKECNSVQIYRDATLYNDPCNKPKMIEYYSLRNRIRRHKLFDDIQYKQFMFAVTIIVIIILFIMKMVFMAKKVHTTEIAIFGFNILFLALLAIVFLHNSPNATYKENNDVAFDLKEYDKIMDKIKEDNREYVTTNKAFRASLLENILMVHPYIQSEESILEQYINNGEYVNYIDFNDCNAISLKIEAKDLDFLRNTYKLEDRKDSYSYNMYIDLMSYYYGPQLTTELYLHHLNYIMVLIALTLLMMFILKRRWI